jgi:hypothetical protein
MLSLNQSKNLLIKYCPKANCLATLGDIENLARKLIAKWRSSDLNKCYKPKVGHVMQTGLL